MNSNLKTIAAVVLILGAMFLVWRQLSSDETASAALSAPTRVELKRTPPPKAELIGSDPYELVGAEAVKPKPPKQEAIVIAEPAEPELEVVPQPGPALRPARTERKVFKQRWQLEVDLSQMTIGIGESRVQAPEATATVTITSKIGVLDVYGAEGLGAQPNLIRTLEVASESSIWSSPEQSEEQSITLHTSPYSGSTAQFVWEPHAQKYKVSIQGRRSAATRDAFASGYEPKRINEFDGDHLVEDMDMRSLGAPNWAGIGAEWEASHEALASFTSPGGDWEFESTKPPDMSGDSNPLQVSILPAMSTLKAGWVNLSLSPNMARQASVRGSRNRYITVKFGYEVSGFVRTKVPTGNPKKPEIDARVAVSGDVEGQGKLLWNSDLQRFSSWKATAVADLRATTMADIGETGGVTVFSFPLKGTVDFEAECKEVGANTPRNFEPEGSSAAGRRRR
ncbi:MAG: hypothetical protein ACI841_004946 [Planctomycetota bacterium]